MSGAWTPIDPQRHPSAAWMIQETMPDGGALTVAYAHGRDKAMLVAAAPVMLAALKRAERNLTSERCAGAEHACLSPETHEIVRAAIAKAEGRP